MQGMRRAYSPLLRDYLRYFPCVAIIGPRQCGKTTFLKELPHGWKIFDLEKSSDFEVISRDPELFLRLNLRHIALDEAQILPELFPALRVAIDQHRSEKGRFVITGSSSPNLLRSISESLAGRIGIIEMAPFSSAEAYGLSPSPLFACLVERHPVKTLRSVLKPRHTLQQIHTYWLRGGYPEPWLRKSLRFHETWMDQYVQSYVQRDIARLFPGLNQNRFRLFIRLLAGLSGTILNYSEVARSLGVSVPTVRDYLEIAHGSFLWRNIPPYEKKALKRIVKHPRGYLRDTGVLHHLLRIDSRDSLLSHPQMGHSWESLVIEEVLRGLAVQGVSFDYFYYRTSAGAEVDLVLEGSWGVIPIEIKYTQVIPTNQLRGIIEFIDERKCPFGLVINNDDQVRLYTEKLLGVPLAYL